MSFWDTLGAIMSPYDYVQEKRNNQLLGEAPAQYSMGQPMPGAGGQAGMFGMDPFGQPQAPMTQTAYHPGSGLLGGQMSEYEYLARLGNRNPQNTRTWMQGAQSNMGAMQRQQQAQQYYGDNMSAYQNALVGQGDTRLAQQDEANYHNRMMQPVSYTHLTLPTITE